MRSRLISGLALVLCACSDSHAPPVRCADGVCPGGQICLSDEGAICVATCDPLSVGRCDNGAACLSYRGLSVCWPGRTVPRGSPGLSEYECAFGLSTQPDYQSEPLRQVCEPVCNTLADCGAGEQCLSRNCVEPCSPTVGCEAGSHCITTYRVGICVNERRFARIDCDGDRDLVTECGPSLACDPEDRSRCIHVPMGEE